jgi:iron complex outermembrane receptor protein
MIFPVLQLQYDYWNLSVTYNVNDLYNSITNQILSVVNDFTYNIRNPQKVQHHLAKMNYNYYFDETVLAVQYSFQFNKRLEFDVRREILVM